MHKKITLLVLLLLITRISTALTICESKKAKSTIVLGAKSSDIEKYAAKELVETIKKMSDVSLPYNQSHSTQIIIGTPGSNDLVAKYAKHLNLNKKGERIAVCVLDGRLFLAGSTPSNVLYAVYTFLDKLGARWFWPGDTGEYIPEHSTISVDNALCIRESPALRLRGLHTMRSNVTTEIWMARNRMNYIRSRPNQKQISRRRKLGFFITIAGHSIGPVKKDFKDHPEYYALINGKRRMDISRPHVCWSNNEVKKYFAERTVKYLKKMNIDLYQLYSTDSMNYCQCKACSKEDRCTTWHRFLMDVSRQIKQNHRGAKIGTLAYQGYLPLPKCDVKYLDYLEFCMYGRCYRHTFAENCEVNRRELESLGKWLKTGVPVTIRGYEFDVFKPNMSIQLGYLMSDQIKKYSELGVDGYFSEASDYPSKKWNAFRMSWYILGRMMWNPHESLESIVNNWCTTIFGPAGKTMRSYYKLMENAWRKIPNHISYYFHNPNGTSLKLINPKLIQKVNKILKLAYKEAEKAGKDKSQQIRKQIKFEEKQFMSWKNLYKKNSENSLNSTICIPELQFSTKLEALQNSDIWKRSARFPAFVTRTGKNAENKTEVNAFYNNKSLYFRLISYDSHIERLAFNCRKHDGRAYSDEGIEMFFRTPDQPAAEYFHMAINSGGFKYDAIGKGGMKFDRSWNPEWSGRVWRSKNKWTCILELPFAEFGGKPLENSNWAFSIKRTKGRRKDLQHSGFPDASFHNPDGYGQLKFVKQQPQTLFIFQAGMRNKNLQVEASQYKLNPVSINSLKKLQSELSSNRNAVLLMSIVRKSDYPGRQFMKKHIAPWVENGGLLIISAGRNISPDFWFTSPDLKIKRYSRMQRTQALNIKDIIWTNTPNNLRKYLKRQDVPNGAFFLKNPAAWKVLAQSKGASDNYYAWLFMTKHGKGWLIVTTAGMSSRGGSRLFCRDAVATAKLICNLNEYVKVEL